jgi:hypothetical protein
MSKVFVSYAHADSEVVKDVLLRLKQAGIDTEYGQIHASQSFHKTIKQLIDQADCILVLWSDAAAQSQFVQQEVTMAIEAWSEDRLILASLDRTELPPGLRDLEAVDLSTDRDRGIKRIVELVGKIAPPPVVAADEVDQPSYHAEILRELANGTTEEGTVVELDPPPPARRKAWVGWVIITLLLAALFVPLFVFWSRVQETLQDIILRVSASASQVALPIPLLTIFVTLAVSLVTIFALAWRAIRSRPLVLYRRRLRPRRTIALDSPTISHRAVLAEDSARYAPGHQVFVSYSYADWTLVDEIVRQIQELGYKVWVDRYNESTGRYAGPIVRAIRSCNVVALMASQNSFSSDHVVREVYVAGGRKKPFISVLLDESEIPDEFEYFVEGFPRTAPPIDPIWLKAQLSRYVV